MRSRGANLHLTNLRAGCGGFAKVDAGGQRLFFPGTWVAM